MWKGICIIQQHKRQIIEDIEDWRTTHSVTQSRTWAFVLYYFIVKPLLLSHIYFFQTLFILSNWYSARNKEYIWFEESCQAALFDGVVSLAHLSVKKKVCCQSQKSRVESRWLAWHFIVWERILTNTVQLDLKCVGHVC